MRSSSGGDGNTTIGTTTTTTGGNNSSGVSSSSNSNNSSSYPTFSTPNTNNLIPTPRRTMEEVWKDISLASLQDHPPREVIELGGAGELLSKNNTHPHGRTTLGGINLQDFLARPFDKDPPATAGSSSTTGGDFSGFGSPAPPPATALCLNSGPEFHYMDNTTDPFRSHGHLENQHNDVNVASSLVATLNSPFDAFGSSTAMSSFCRKRVPETKENSGDRRHKRMIKNRESAARSRARKQAYTNELELEVAHLMEENARLRKQQQQLYLAAAAQLPKKHTLQRTSTAPF